MRGVLTIAAAMLLSAGCSRTGDDAKKKPDAPSAADPAAKAAEPDVKPVGTTFRNDEFKFSVVFWEAPEINGPEVIDWPMGNMKMQQFLVHREPRIQMVSLERYDAGLGLTRDESMKFLRDSMLKPFNAQTTSEKFGELDGRPMLESTAKLANGLPLSMRIIRADRTIYGLLVGGPGATPDAGGVRAFFNGFRTDIPAAPVASDVKTCNHNGKFGLTVRVPGFYKESVKTEATPLGDMETLALQGTYPREGRAYNVTAGLRADGDKADDKAVLDVFRDHAAKRFNGKLRGEKEIKVSGKPGRELVLDSDLGGEKKVLTVQVAVAGRRIYLFVAAADPGAPESPETKEFFGSIAIKD